MASPPYTQNISSVSAGNSVSHSPLLQLTKRRPSDISSLAPSNKRRKPSVIAPTLNLASHPLRHTSFPTEILTQSPRNSRSPSIDRASVVSGSFNLNKKKKNRRAKGKDNDNSTLLGTRATSASLETNKGIGKINFDQNLEDEEEEAGQELAANPSENTKEERAKEERRRHLLTRAFNQEQWQRYEAWRSSKLSDSVVRRIVNQTLSQSAPQQVILAVRSVAKIFAGDMIERARKVQTEWLEISGENPGFPKDVINQSVPKEKEKRRGPLMPDHLREAFRRHLLTDIGLVGHLGLWQHQQSGVVRFGARLSGKRIFK